MASTFDVPDRSEAPPKPRSGIVSSGIVNSVAANEDSFGTAVSWAAIFAGALAATAITIILLVIGTGIGLSTVSPWYGAGASAATVGVAAVVWLVVVQWISSGIGGFLAGRLRTKWARLHAHEVFFRDTAHGFLAWSLASVAGALLFASATTSTTSGIARGAAEATGTGLTQLTQAAVNNGPGTGDALPYFTDTLFRSAANNGDNNPGQSTPEAARIPREAFKEGRWSLHPRMRSIWLRLSPLGRV